MDAGKRALWLETLAVLALAVVPDVWFALDPWIFGGTEPMPLARVEALILARSFQVAVPVLWIVSRSGAGWATFGLVRPRWGRDLGLGFGILGALLLVIRLFEVAAVQVFGPEFFAVPEWCAGPRPSPGPAWEHALLVGTHLANAFAEELVVRGYLIDRFERLFGSRFDAVLLSSTAFASYHVYQGLGAAIDLFLFGLVLGIVFVRSRRLWPCVVAHALWNLLVVEYGVHRVFCAW